jgi:molybdate transport system regulatory protein
MQAPSDIAPGFSLQPRLRVFEGERMVLGWGKILLLRQVRETGSIAEAARRMDISYNHAWTLIRSMNESFTAPLVEATRGGRGRGGAQVTATGESVLRLYHEMAAECLKATESQWASLRGILKPREARLPAGENS